MQKYLFVFDIETVPDVDSVRALTGCTSDDVGVLREELSRYHLEVTDGKNAFPRQPFHKIVALSYLMCRIDVNVVAGMPQETYSLVKLCSNEIDNESNIVEAFFRYIDKYSPRLVSFNGRTFDVPVLKYRAMKYGIDGFGFYAAGDKWDGYLKRYSQNWHCDLLDVLSDYGSSARVKLNEVCAILGLPGKYGVDGGSVTDMYDSGRIQDIKDYCETDVLNTYLVYLRCMLHSAKISAQSYDAAVQDVINYIDSSGADHLLGFKRAWFITCGGKFLINETA